MQIYFYIGIVLIFLSTWQFYSVYVKKRSVIRSGGKDYTTKHPQMVKRFFTAKYIYNFIAGVSMIYVITQINNPRWFVVPIMLLCVTIILESVSIYIVHKSVQ